MKTLMLGVGLVSGMTLTLAQGQEAEVSPATDRLQYSVESKVLYVQDELRPEYADSSPVSAFGSSRQGAWLAPSGKPVFTTEPETLPVSDRATLDYRFDWMNAREDVELISAPRISLHGWRPGDTTFSDTNTLFKFLLANGGDAAPESGLVDPAGGIGGFGGGRGTGSVAFSNVSELFFADFPAPLDPRFFYGRGIIADIRTDFIPYKLSREASTQAPEPITLHDGVVIAPRVVITDTSEIALDYVLNYQSAENIPDDTLLTRDEINSRISRAYVGMDLTFADGETQRIIVPLSNGDFLDVYVTVDKITNTGTKQFDAN